MNELCVNLVTRSELRGHSNLARVLRVLSKEREFIQFDKVSFFEPIRTDFTEGIIPSIASTDNYSILLKDSSHTISASIWMNNWIRTIFLETNRWNENIIRDVQLIIKEIADIVIVDFAFLDILTNRVVQNGIRMGAVRKTHRDKDSYIYSLFPKALSRGVPDAYHYMLFSKDVLKNVAAFITEMQTVYEINVSERYLDCNLSEKMGVDDDEVNQKKDCALKIITSYFMAEYWTS